MGTEFVSDNQNDSKKDFTTATVVAASVAIAAGELYLWVGSTAIAAPMVEVVNALKRCRDAILEAGAPIPANTFEVIALCEPKEPKSAVVVTNQAALPTIAETDVLIGYGETYFAGGNRLVKDRIDALIDTFIESQKAA